MKYIIKTVLISLFAISTTMASEKVDNFTTAKTQPNLKEWTETFQTKVGAVMHTPKSVSMGGMSAGTVLNLSSKVMNGVTLKAPIVLAVNSSREDFIEAMRKSGIID